MGFCILICSSIILIYFTTYPLDKQDDEDLPSGNQPIGRHIQADTATIDCCVRIQEIYDQSEQIYSYRKITATLRSQGIVVSEKFVSQLMRELGISSLSPTAKKNHRKWEKGVNRNFLQQQFCAERPNQVWVSDITTFKFRSKSYYICVIIDLFSRRVLSYRISCKSSTQLLTKTFKEANTERKPPCNLMFHSDRGTQYMSYSFVRLLESLNIKEAGIWMSHF